MGWKIRGQVGGGAGVIRHTCNELANQTGSWGSAVIYFKSPVFCVVLVLRVELRMSLRRDRSPMQVFMSWVFAVIALDQCLLYENSYLRIRVKKWASALTTNWGCGAE